MFCSVYCSIIYSFFIVLESMRLGDELFEAFSGRCSLVPSSEAYDEDSLDSRAAGQGQPIPNVDLGARGTACY